MKTLYKTNVGVVFANFVCCISFVRVFSNSS